MIIVSDTSPITNLYQIGKLYLLESLFKQVIIPSKVFEELSELPIQKAFIENQAWISVQSSQNLVLIEFLEEKLDAGESQAIALALELHADYLIIDEIEGREVAEELGLKIVGILGILMRAKENNLINKVKPLMDDLVIQAGFRINPKLYSEVLKRANE